MKKILSYLLLMFILFGFIGNNIYAATFIQKSTRQNSAAVANNDPVTAGKWNGVVLDLSNIIEDLGSLKRYVDDNVSSTFIITPSRMENTDRDIAISKKLIVGGELKGNGEIIIPIGGLKDNTINSANLKNQTIKLEDFDASVSFGNEEFWTQSGPDTYYNDSNIGIGKDTADEKLNLKSEGNIPKNGMVALYTFKNGSSKNMINGIDKGIHGIPTIHENNLGVVNSSLLFGNNTEDYMNIDTSVISGLQDFTFNIFAKRAGDNSSIYSFLSGASTNNNDVLLLTKPGRTEILINGSIIGFGTSLGYLDDTTKWHLMTFTRSGGTYKIYSDGVLKGTNSGHSNPIRQLHDLQIGQENDSNTGLGGFDINQNINGSVSYFSTYNRALSDTEIQNIYKNLTTPGNIYIKTNGNGILYPDGTIQTTAMNIPNNIVTLTGDQDIDGNKKFNKNIELATNEEWILVKEENINNPTGWSYTNKVTQCGDWGAIIGGYNVMSGKNNEKTFSLDGIEHSAVKVTLDYIAIDSWDGENAYVKIDDTTVYNKTPSGTRYQKCGSTNSGWEEWKIPISVEKVHTGNTVKIGIGSTLNQDPYDESFGYNNLKIYVKAKSAKIENIKDINTAFISPDHKSLVTTNAIRKLVKDNSVSGKPGICGADNGRTSDRKPLSLCEYGGPSELQFEEVDLDPNAEIKSSCREIKESKSDAESGMYTISIDGDKKTVYCDMETDGGGWTLVLKADGTKQTFSYSSDYWKNSDTYNEGDNKHDDKEFKSSLFSTMGLKEVLLEMKTNGDYQRIQIPKTANSLKDIFNGGYQSTNLSKNRWLKTVKGSELQSNCNEEGFNTSHGVSARIGFSSNNENNCGSNDSAIGIGLSPRGSSKSTVGNILFTSKNIKSMGYLYIRDKKPTLPILKNCREIKEQLHGGNGTYTINPGNGNLTVYCDMETDGGGWTLVGRGREGWVWSDSGMNTGDVAKNVGTNGAFVPAFYPSATIDKIINNKKMSELPDGLRIKRAITVTGSMYQEVRWKFNSLTNYSWLFENRIPLSMTVDGTSVSVSTSQRSRDTGGSGNNDTRLFTRGRSGHDNKKGFCYGNYGTAGQAGQNNNTSFIWEKSNEQHALPYTEVYIRDKAPVNNSKNSSCRAIKENNKDAPSGIYTINSGSGTIEVYCDMETDGGGWTRFLKYKESDGGNNPGTRSDLSSYKLTITPSNNEVEVLLDGCTANNPTLVLEPNNTVFNWIKLPEDKSLSNILAKDSIASLKDNQGRTIEYGHNNSDANNEFETLTFSTHNHTSTSHIRQYAKWGAIDCGNTNTRSSYNNVSSYANGDMNNSDQWICAAYRDKKPLIKIIKDKKAYAYTWTCEGDDNMIAKCGQINTNKPKTIIKINDVREYSDGTQAPSCDEYIHPRNSNLYEGETGNGFYYIKPDPRQDKIKVYCEMNADGGGWTRFVKIRGKYTPNEALNCYKGDIIDNSYLECFNPNRYNLSAREKLMIIADDVKYYKDIPDDSSKLDDNHFEGGGYKCIGNQEYMSVMRSGSYPNTELTDVSHIWLGQSYCSYGWQIGGSDIGGGSFMNYSGTSFGPRPGSREGNPKSREIYIR